MCRAGVRARWGAGKIPGVEIAVGVEIVGPVPTSRVEGPTGPSRAEEPAVKYVILIHSNPRPWGHPTGEFIPEQRYLNARASRLTPP